MNLRPSSIDSSVEELSKFDSILDQLVENGFAIIDNLLPVSDATALHQRILELEAENEFEKSGIGKLAVFQIDEEIRGDYIRWIDFNDIPLHLSPYFSFLQNLIPQLNRSLFLNLKDLESHYAFYPAGSGYKKHRDRFRQNPHRVLSVVFYLNPLWKINDGGELVIYDDKVKELVKVEPLFNRLAIFRSEFIHEVLPCHTRRNSITTWFLDKELELTFL